MNVEEIRENCLSKPGDINGFPFNDTALVLKVAGKMSALTGLDLDPPYVNLKCDIEWANELMEEY